MKIFILPAFLFCLIAGDVWASEGFAVVELFSSEGCSRCPPADDLLRELTQQARADKKRIFTLSFQVDYWNDLGWKDPFSSPQFTQRQYQYAKALGSSSVYTPQMVVNGQDGFVGSDGNKATKSIERFVNMPAANGISLEMIDGNAGQIELSYTCDQLSPQAVIHFALVESGLESRVTAGENQGRILKHEHIVRELRTVPLTQLKGIVIFQNPAVENISRFSIIAYVQNEADMHILGADGVDLK